MTTKGETMAKMGIAHDYDLMANAEPAAQQQTCAVCDAAPMGFRWTDRNGEAMCLRCGCPYQLMNGSDEQIAEGAYPYMLLRPEVVPVIRRYFAETGRFTTFGMFLGPRPGIAELGDWIDAHRSDPDVVAAYGEPKSKGQSDA